MGRHSDQDNSSKAVIWIVVGVVGGLTFFGALILVVGIMAYRNLGASPNKAKAPGPVAKMEPAKQNGINVGNIAPEIEGQDIGGTPFKLSEYQDKVVMLDFWGNW